jgi:hypothetical protein
MIPLRIALGVCAFLALCAALLGAVMSVKINWEFALTLGRNAEWGFYLALAFAAVEGTRLLMPFLRRGLTLADLKGPARGATVAFWVFTLISASSAGGFFAMNRADSNAQRTAQLSQTKSYQQEMNRLTERLERHKDVRSVAEVEAELKAIPKADPDKRKPALELERATALQRDKDEARLKELRGSAEWKLTLQTAIASTDGGLDWLTAAAPIDKDVAQKWGMIALILSAIVAIELLVGFTPFAATMVLVWAIKPPPTSRLTETGKKPNKTDTPPDLDGQQKPGISYEAALKDLREFFPRRKHDVTVAYLCERWRSPKPTVHWRLKEMERRRQLTLGKSSEGRTIVVSVDPALKDVKKSQQTVSAS